MKRFVALAVFAAAIAAVAVAASAHTGSAATRSDSVVVVTEFPAAGTLKVNSVIVRRKPAITARKIKTLKYFRSDFRVQEILAVASAKGPSGVTWYRISMPMRPNGTYGWIPAKSASLTPTVAQIIVDRTKRTIDVFRNDKHVWHGKVAIGAPGMETPLGHYYVDATFVPDDDFLGVFALETSAYSKLTEWPGGGVVGIHGTNAPQLLGMAVSHGCIRVSNLTATKLKQLTPLGTPIWVKA